MSEQEGDGRRQKRQLNEGGTELNVTVVSEEMMDKLRILNYEQEYCNRKQIDVFHQHYFTIADNQAKQFSDFVSLVSWLMRLQNVSFNVDKYDDANTSVNNLMMTLRSMDFSVDFPPAKLRNGAGVEVCAVVSFLCDRVLENQRFQFSTPNYPAEELSEQAEVEDDADGAVEEENMGGGGRGGMPNDSDGEEEVMYSEQLRSERKDEDEQDDAAHAKLETDIDPLIWQTELERVAPHLKVKKIHGGKEWRAHIELTKKHGDNVNRILPESRKKLAMISDAIKTSMERLQGKERYLNSHFDGMVTEFKTVQERLKTIQARHETAGESVSQYQNNLQSIMERLEEVKGLMDERSGSMTDTSPVVRIKKALQEMKREIKEMELRMGVLSHTLMHAKMRQKLSRDASIEAKASGKNDSGDW